MEKSLSLIIWEIVRKLSELSLLIQRNHSLEFVLSTAAEISQDRIPKSFILLIDWLSLDKFWHVLNTWPLLNWLDESLILFHRYLTLKIDDCTLFEFLSGLYWQFIEFILILRRIVIEVVKLFVHLLGRKLWLLLLDRSPLGL